MTDATLPTRLAIARRLLEAEREHRQAREELQSSGAEASRQRYARACLELHAAEAASSDFLASWPGPRPDQSFH